MNQTSDDTVRLALTYCRRFPAVALLEGLHSVDTVPCVWSAARKRSKADLIRLVGNFQRCCPRLHRATKVE